jgi:antitoxin component of RelBE/YafQ-DinJ toxin-antitoxin module
MEVGMAVVRQDGRVNVRFKASEVARMRALAERYGITVSELVRLWAFRGLRQRILPESARVVEGENVGASVAAGEVGDAC